LVTDRVRIQETQTVYVGLLGHLVPLKVCTAAGCTPDAEKNPAAEGMASTSPKDDGTPPKDSDPAKKGDSDEDPRKTEKPAAEIADAASPTSSGVSIIWLPDYCEQYAYNSKSILAKADATVSLADGCRLESVASSQDSTAIASKLFDLVGIRMQADAATKQARIEASKPTTPSALSAQFVPVQWIRTDAWDLYPGLYPIFKRDNCDSNPRFEPKSFDIRPSVSWTRLTP
jgi:hypothetical protein